VPQPDPSPTAASDSTSTDPNAQPLELDPGPPVTLTAVRQHVIGPTSQWRFDPDGRYVAWTNEDQCGLWSYDSGMFLGYFERQPDDPCERWSKGLTRYIESSAIGPVGTAMAEATASVNQTRLVVVAADKAKLLDVTCKDCRQYRAVAWSPDGTQVAAARSDPWGVDVWSVAKAELVDGLDVDAQGKEKDIGVLWGRKGMFAFVSHAFDPNEGKYGDPDSGMEDYTHVHGPALSSFWLPLPRPPSRQGEQAGPAHELRSVSHSLAALVIDPQLGAAWVHVRDEDPRAFGHHYWEAISLGGMPGIGAESRSVPPSVSQTLAGSYGDARWVERPYEILEAQGVFTRAEDQRETTVHEMLGIGVSGHAEGAAWLRRTITWSNRDSPTMELRDAKLDGVGLDWAEQRGSVCPTDQGEEAPRDCEPFGLQHRCELVDFSPSGKRMLGWCTSTLALLERDGTTVLELGTLPPSEVRWRWVDGDTLALLGGDRNLQLISIASGTVRETIPDVRQIHPLVAGAEFGLFAYRTGAGFHLRSVDGQRRFERSEGVFAAAIDPTGEHVAVTDQKHIEIYEIATGTRLAKWRASKMRKLAYRQDGAVLFGTQVRERGPTRAWDPRTGEERNEAIPSAEIAGDLADSPSWRFGWTGKRLRRTLDGRTLTFDYGSAMLDNGLYEGEIPRALTGIVLRRGDSISDFQIYDAVDLAPALRREGLFAAFMAGEPLPEVVIGEHELARLLEAKQAAKIPKIADVLDSP
jgi:WD40 repeat protein